MRTEHDRSLAFAPRVTLAQRFWQIAPQRRRSARGGGPATTVVGHLIGILRSLRDVDLAREPDTTVATLSLLTLLRQQEMSGDLNYASPEQLRGETLSESALVFSVAVLLFERLCERHPFSQEESPLRFLRMRRGELGSGVNFFPIVPAPLRAVMQRALSSRAEDRPQTLNQLADELVDQLPALIESERASTAQPPQVALSSSVVIDDAPLSLGEQIGRLLERTTPTHAEPAPPPTTVSWYEARTSRGNQRGAAPRVARPAWRHGITWIGLVTLAATAGALWHRSWRHSVAREVPAAALTAAVPVPTPLAPAAVGVTPPTDGELSAPNPLPYFDPELAAAEATQAADRCFSLDERRGSPVDFGLSMLFSPMSARATKVYFPLEPELDAAHADCLARALRGVSAGAAPGQFRAVECRFRVGADGIRAVVRRTVP